jgi:hypothetical protein
VTAWPPGRGSSRPHRGDNEGFPDVAHDDEVDAGSGALEMLNPQMKGWGIYEFYRQKAEELRAEKERGRTPQPAPPNPAPGSMEWLAEQNSRNESS